MGAMDEIDKKIRLDKIAQSDVKLTKLGKKYSQLSLNEIEKFLKLDRLINNDSLSLNTLLGVSVNPNINSDIILKMFKLLFELSKKENKDKNIPQATKTRNLGLRSKIRRLLTHHPNLDNETISKLIMTGSKNSENVLGNPSISEENLQVYFDSVVLNPNYKEYSFLSFGKLAKAKNVSQTLMDKWYNKLVKFADWTYSDNKWYSVVNSLIEFEDLSETILIDIAGAPLSDKSMSQWNRSGAVDHKNATEKVAIEAYKITADEKYLPKTVKDIFLF